ncbi:MAG: hypothetical protein GKS05_07625 [Nitrospirales bacterium]|nr:hypothetical protein [Nitrospirales bacterium]
MMNVMKKMSTGQFREQLFDLIDRKQHWATPHFNGPTATKEQLHIHFRQEYAVYIRDFSVLLARVLGENPPWDVRRHLSTIIYEKETGGLSLDHPHHELFLQMMMSLGYHRGDFREVALLSISRMYREWLDKLCHVEDWLISTANLTILIEGTSNDRQDVTHNRQAQTQVEIEDVILKHPLSMYHNLNPKDMDFIRVREMVEPWNRHIVYDLIVKEAVATGQQKLVLESLEEGLRMWLQYRDGIARACGLRKP